MDTISLQPAIAIPGHMTDIELEWIMTQTSALPPLATWVELGVFCGRSLMAAALGMPMEGTLLAVDLRLGMDTIDGCGFLETYQKISTCRPDLRIIGMKMPGDAAAAYVTSAGVDGVFIDADHDYAPVCRDIQAWLPKVKPGGLLCGHDFDEVHWPGVVNAVRELVPGASRTNAGTIWSLPIQK